MSRTMIIVIALIFGVLSVLGGAWAAPMGRRGQPVPSDEILTLARLTELELVISTIPEPLEAVGMEAAAIHSKWGKQLVDAGFKITKGIGGRKVPSLRLVMLALVDPQTPDMVSFTLLLSLEQEVTIERLDRKFVIPTWTGVQVGMKQANQVRVELDQRLEGILHQFIVRTELATAHQ